MTTLELFLLVALFTENVALLLAHIVDGQSSDRDEFGEAATRAMRSRR